MQRSGRELVRGEFLFCRVDFHDLSPSAIDEFCPCCRVRRESAYEIICPFYPVSPLYSTSFPEDFWCSVQFGFFSQRLLRDGVQVTFNDGVDSLPDEFCAKVHEAVVHITGIIGVEDWYRNASDNIPGVDVMVKEEGGNAGLCLTVDNGPIDGCCTTILWQERGVKVERPERGLPM